MSTLAIPVVLSVSCRCHPCRTPVSLFLLLVLWVSNPLPCPVLLCRMRAWMVCLVRNPRVTPVAPAVAAVQGPRRARGRDPGLQADPGVHPHAAAPDAARRERACPRVSRSPSLCVHSLSDLCVVVLCVRARLPRLREVSLCGSCSNAGSCALRARRVFVCLRRILCACGPACDVCVRCAAVGLRRPQPCCAGRGSGPRGRLPQHAGWSRCRAQVRDPRPVAVVARGRVY